MGIGMSDIGEMMGRAMAIYAAILIACSAISGVVLFEGGSWLIQHVHVGLTWQ